MVILHMDRPDYENDIRALLMSFFFGEKIVDDRQLENMKPEDRIFAHEFTFASGGGSIRLSVADLPAEAGSGQGASDPAPGQGAPDPAPAETASPAEYRPRSLVRDCSGLDRRAERDAVKEAVYTLLSQHTGHKLPWGTLTGVRPTKIPMEILERGGDTAAASAYMQEHYLVSDEKASLAAQVARRELDIIRSLDAGCPVGEPLPGFSLYLGIPFCPSICAYCSFSSYPIKAWAGRIGEYLDSLESEIKAVPEAMVRPASFYMGGGTPTSLDAQQLDRILGCLEERFDMGSCPEKTVEAGRPDSITAEKLRVMKKHGVNRISINPQTMSQKTLDMIGRRHSVQDIRDAFRLAREEGFSNINMDLIAGLPGETSADMRRTMEQVCELGPDSITVHSLALKRAAFLNRNRELFPVADAQEVNRMIGISHEYAAAAGMEPYYLYRQKNIAGNLENVGYSKPGCECSYNVIIMEEIQSIAALGAGSISKRVFPGHRIERCANVKSVEDYIARTAEMTERKRRLFM